MGTIRRKRGRPASPNASTPAERMRAYRARKRAAGLKPVVQWVPDDSHNPITWSDHRVLDVRSLALHCKIAQKISRNLDLLDIPRRNLDRWAARAGTQIPQYITEWQRILEKPWPQIAMFITGCSEEATRLRQSSPFAGVLDARERKKIYEAFRA